jgi:hypothetical protein
MRPRRRTSILPRWRKEGKEVVVSDQQNIFPAGTAGHIRSILSKSAFMMEQLQTYYTLEQWKAAWEFVQTHPDFARSSLWNKTKAAVLGRIIRKREKAERKRESARQFHLNL